MKTSSTPETKKPLIIPERSDGDTSFENLKEWVKYSSRERIDEALQKKLDDLTQQTHSSAPDQKIQWIKMD